MLKNKFLGVISVSIALFTFFSCNNNTTVNIETKTVDLRNYNADGEIYNGSRSVLRAADDLSFSVRLADVSESGVSNFYRWGKYYCDDDCPEWVKETITIEDSENGINITYHRPDDPEAAPFKDKAISWFNIAYIDGNKNASTSTVVPWKKMNESYQDEKGQWKGRVKETFSSEYPLLLPGKKSIIWVQYGYDCGEDNPNQFSIVFVVNPVHGKGCIKDLEKNFVSIGEPKNPLSINYASLVETEDGLNLVVKDVIPPQGKNLRRAYCVREQDADTKFFDLNWNQIGWADEEVTEPSECFTVDLTKYSAFSNVKNKPYVFVEVNYSYELEEFPELTFKTPLLKTAIVKTDKFHK